MMLGLYRSLTTLAAPFLPFYLRRRLARGKEDAARLPERFGYARRARPEGMLVWLHAASVGEANSLLPLIRDLHTHAPQCSLLLTSGTVTSATLMQSHLPQGAIHQFVPVDTPFAVRRFLDHWQPDIALWAESELWPNLVTQSRARGCRMVLVNGRMSQRSFARWQKFSSLIRAMLRCFDVVFAQSEGDGMRLRMCGAGDVRMAGNLKFDAEPLSYNTSALAQMQQQIAGRTIWLAASTHAGEEAVIAQTHERLKERFGDLLTIIVPRHYARGEAIKQELSALGMQISLRSRNEEIKPQTAIYIADSMGELGLFYRLCNIAFVGGSLIPHGGQNVLEAVRLECAVVSGFYTHNFADVVNALEQQQAICLVHDAASLAGAVELLLLHPDMRAAQSQRAAAWLATQTGACAAILGYLQPQLAEPAVQKAAS